MLNPHSPEAIKREDAFNASYDSHCRAIMGELLKGHDQAGLVAWKYSDVYDVAAKLMHHIAKAVTQKVPNEALGVLVRELFEREVQDWANTAADNDTF